MQHPSNAMPIGAPPSSQPQTTRFFDPLVGYPLPSSAPGSHPLPPPPTTVTPHARPFLKAALSPSFAPHNSYDEKLKEKMSDDTCIVTIRDRKVRMSDGGSVYALCRSWLRNGYPEQSQSQYGDAIKSLPRPLPMPDSSSLKRKDRDDEIESDEELRAADNPCAKELLRRHIKRAKRIRERLREERLQRIKRYDGRLSMLLPQPVDQCRNDVFTGPSPCP